MNLIQQTIFSVNKLAPFGKFERLTAGFCMAIPFILLIVDEAADNSRHYWWLFIPFVMTIVPPIFLPAIFGKFKKERYYGAWLTLFAAILLIVCYLVFTQWLKLDSKSSISAYVTMRDSFIFGMTLAIGAMLFISAGVVYYESQQKEKKWRRWLNILAGIFLLFVIIFPCNKLIYLHGISASIFFFLCTVGTIRRERSKKKDKETPEQGRKKRNIQLLADCMPMLIITISFAMWAGPHWEIFKGPDPNPFTLYGVESIALWIVGVDFILVSLKREDSESINIKEKELALMEENLY